MIFLRFIDLKLKVNHGEYVIDPNKGCFNTLRNNVCFGLPSDGSCVKLPDGCKNYVQNNS